jgi:cytochrome c5
MRYLSLLIVVTLTMLISTGCQEESPPAQTMSKPAGQDTDKTMAATEQKSQKVMEHIKEESHKSIEHARTEAHKTMDTAHESTEHGHDAMSATQEGMKMTSVDEATLAMGKRIYEQTCATCHATGVAGAPKMGDKEAWSAHIHHGIDHLMESAINGKGAMPARGGNALLSDEEVKAAVNYMVEQNR